MLTTTGRWIPHRCGSSVILRLHYHMAGVIFLRSRPNGSACTVIVMGIYLHRPRRNA